MKIPGVITSNLNKIKANTITAGKTSKNWLGSALKPDEAGKSYILNGINKTHGAAYAKNMSAFGKEAETQATKFMSEGNEEAARIWAERATGYHNQATEAAKKITESTGLLDYAAVPGRYVKEAWDRKAYGQAAARAGVVGAGYVGAAGITRSVVAGGGMFRDSKGNFDIAGVPFV